MSEGSSWGQPPLPPSLADSREEHWMHFDSSVNAISFGFVATAILISMFLVMAIFERFLRQRSQQQQPPAMVRGLGDPEAPLAHAFPCKLEGSPPTMSVYAKGVSVLMPGQQIPTFIAHPAPIPCNREHVLWPHHQHSPFSNFTQTWEHFCSESAPNT
ncbi:uncharacterized protein LOC116249529 [Nymphaea colorata]|nr:uncharacterized protein LOC116249529 [Nymphaea colorata]